MTGKATGSATQPAPTMHLEQFAGARVALRSLAGAITLFALVFPLAAHAVAPASVPTAASPIATAPLPPAPLPVDEAFAATASLTDGNISVRFDVLPGHYLFRDRFEFRRDDGGAQLIDAFAQLPAAAGKTKKDPSFGDVKVFEQPLTLNAGHTARAKTQLVVTFQGCSTIAGVCYPPVRRTFALTQGLRNASPNEVEKPGLSDRFKKRVSSAP
jgi:thiol:disulfide interchange protein